eukprot:gene11425-15310_t
MGPVFGTRTFIRRDDVDGQGKAVLIYGKKMQLTNHQLDRLYHEFSKFEDPKTNLVPIILLFKSYRCKYNLFNMILFQLFDKEKSGLLNFLEYVIIVWCLLSTNNDTLATLCFNLFDVERSSTLSVSEVIFLIHLLWEFKPNKRVIKALKNLHLNKDGIVTVAEFCLLCRHFPELLKPIQYVKKQFRRFIVFKRFWVEIESKRHAYFPTETIFDITERYDHDYVACSMDYLLLSHEVPFQFIEQWKLLSKRKNILKNKVNVELPYELFEEYNDIKYNTYNNNNNNNNNNDNNDMKSDHESSQEISLYDTKQNDVHT